jgi:hypothetical protein
MTNFFVRIFAIVAVLGTIALNNFPSQPAISCDWDETGSRPSYLATITLSSETEIAKAMKDKEDREDAHRDLKLCMLDIDVICVDTIDELDEKFGIYSLGFSKKDIDDLIDRAYALLDLVNAGEPTYDVPYPSWVVHPAYYTSY